MTRRFPHSCCAFLFITRIFIVFFILLVSHHIDSDHDRQDENIILTGFDIHTVGIRQAEPFLRDFGDLVSALLDLILIVKDVALHIQVGTTFDYHIPFVTQWGDQRLLDYGHLFALRVFDFHRFFD